MARKIFKPALKRSRSTREILQRSIKDIKDGLWICGDLTQSCPINGTQKPMGCALGLVQINSGMFPIYLEVETQWDFDQQKQIKTGNKLAYANPSYPVEMKKTPGAVAKAVELLAKTARVPKKAKADIYKEVTYDHWGDARLEKLQAESDIVIRYNDSSGDLGLKRLTSASALKWFERALAELDK